MSGASFTTLAVLKNVNAADLTAFNFGGFDPGSATVLGQLIDGTDASETLTGTAGADTINGLAGDDTLYGRAGNDVLNGGDGADQLYGEGGNDILNGGAGRNFFDGGEGDDLLTGGNDLGNLGRNFDEVSYRTAASAVTVDLTQGTATGGGGNDTLVNIERVYGSEFGDTITLSAIGLSSDGYMLSSAIGEGGDDRLIAGALGSGLDGGSGNDELIGGSGDDFFTGGVGNDTIDGGGGTDRADYARATSAVTVDLIKGTAIGGEGNDTLVNIESVFGSVFDDTIILNAANGYAQGAAGDDLLIAGAFGNRLFGIDGNDTLIGGAGEDELIGGAGDDFISGGAGNDFADGGTGNDTINGGDGDDRITSYIGSDTLTGGAGNDSLDGGEGIDTAVYDGSRNDYTVTTNVDGSISVTDNRTGNPNGTDTMIGVERLDIGGTLYAIDGKPLISSNGGGDTASVTVSENGTFVTTVTATDPDANTILSYSISGGADAALFDINAVTGALNFKAATNFEAAGDVGTNNIYDVEVQVSDGTNVDVQALAVSVTNANEAPKITSSGTLLRSSSAGTVDVPYHYIPGQGISINGHTYIATNLSYAVGDDISGNIAAQFGSGARLASWENLVTDLNSSPLVANFLNSLALPVETPYGSYPNLYVSFNGTEQDGSRGRWFVTNFTDSSPGAVGYAAFGELFGKLYLGSFGWSGQALIRIDNAALSVSTTPENTTTSTAVYMASAIDPDAGSMLSYSIVGGADAALFNIDSVTGAVTFKASPNYELPSDGDSNNIYLLTVQASDGVLTDTQSVAINVTDVNNAILVPGSIPDQSVNEDSLWSYQLPASTFSAVNADTFSFSATLSNGAQLPAGLSFDAATRTFSGTPLNFNGNISLTVTASDIDFRASDTFVLTIAPVNDSPVGLGALVDTPLVVGGVFTIAAPNFEFVSLADAAGKQGYASGAMSIEGSWVYTIQAIEPGFSGLTKVTALEHTNSIVSYTSDATQRLQTVQQEFGSNAVLADFNDVSQAYNLAGGNLVDYLDLKEIDLPNIPDYGAGQFSNEGPFVTYNGDIALPGGGGRAYFVSAHDGVVPPGWAAHAQIGQNTIDLGSWVFDRQILAKIDIPLSQVNLQPDGTGFIENSTIYAELGTISDVDGLGPISWQWQRSSDGGATWLGINGAIGVGYTLGAEDAGNIVRAKGNYIDRQGTAETVFTEASSIIGSLNEAPVVSAAIADRSVDEDAAWSFAVPAGTFSDPDGDVLAYTATSGNGSPLPTWLKFNAATQTFSGTPPLNFNGNISLTVTASDPSGLKASDTFVLTVNPVEDEATGSIAVTGMVAEGGTVGVDVNVTDVDGAITGTTYQWQISSDGTDGWTNLSGATSSSYAIASDQSQVGKYLRVVATTTDALGGTTAFTSAATVAIANVNDAPVVVAPIADQTIDEDSPWSYTVPQGTFNDVDGNGLTFTTSELPAWITFDPATQTFSGTPPKNFNGSLNLSVSASCNGLTVTDGFQLVVNAAPDAPIATVPNQSQSCTEDAAWVYQVPAGTFIDPDGDALTYSATLAGSTSLPDWLEFNATTRTFSGTPPLNFNGNISLTVTASDPSGLKASDTFVLTVNPVEDEATGSVAVTGTVAEGGTVGVDANITDVDGAITGTAYQWQISTNGTDGWTDLSGATAATYAIASDQSQVGKYLRVVATTTDALGGTTTFTSAATAAIANVEDEATGSVAVTGTVAEGGTVGVDVNVTDVDGAITATAYQWQISTNGTDGWTDLTSATAATYAIASDQSQVGKYLRVVATTTDALGGTTAFTSPATVAIANVEDEATGSVAVTGTVAEGGTVGVDVNITDVDGAIAGTSYQWQISSDGVNGWTDLSGATAATYAIASDQSQVGKYLRVAATTTDALGGATAFTSAATVAIANVNDAPTVAALIADQSATEDAAFSFVVPAGSFADVDPGDVLTLSVSLADGSPLPTWLSFNAATGTFSGTPLRGDVGAVSVRVTATDVGGLSVSDDFNLTVAPETIAPTAVITDNVPSTATGTVLYTVTFSETVTGLAANDFAVTNGTVSSVTGSGTSYVVAIAPSADFEGTLSLSLNAGAVLDKAGNQNASVAAAGQVVDTRKPVVTAITPAADSTGVAVATNITLAYSEAIRAGTGVIELRNAAGALVESFNVATSNRLTFAGSSLTVDPTALLSGATQYRLSVADGAVLDVAGNAAVALTTYTFTTLSAVNTINGTAVANTLNGTAGDDAIYGFGGNDTLNGNAGNDLLDGGTGNDRMTGGAGDDIYVVDSATDTVTEAANGGNDTVRTTRASYTLANNVENLTYIGDATFSGTGNAANNSITGGIGNDTLDGRAGNDIMTGGLGNDRYVVDSSGDVVVEQSSQGNDMVTASMSYVLGANVENLTLSGNAAINGTGNAVANQITGNSGANILRGAGGADTLNGAGGTDTAAFDQAASSYALDHSGSAVIVSDLVNGEGTDTLTAIENLSFAGANYAIVSGTAAVNTINGGAGSQAIFALGGNDIINGGAGNDIIVAGIGNDAITLASDTGGRDFIDGGAGEDTFTLATATGAEAFVIYTRAAALQALSGLTLNLNTEIVVTRNGQVIAELDNIEEIVVSSLRVTSPIGANGGTVAGDTIQVVGDFNQTSLNFNTITIDGTQANDVVDISALESAHRIVFTSNGGQDTVVGALRPQDIVNMGTGPTAAVDHAMPAPATAVAPTPSAALPTDDVVRGSVQRTVDDNPHADDSIHADDKGGLRPQGVTRSDDVLGVDDNSPSHSKNDDDASKGRSSDDHGSRHGQKTNDDHSIDPLPGNTASDLYYGTDGADMFKFRGGDTIFDFDDSDDIIDLRGLGVSRDNFKQMVSVSQDSAGISLKIGDAIMRVLGEDDLSLSDFMFDAGGASVEEPKRTSDLPTDSRRWDDNPKHHGPEDNLKVEDFMVPRWTVDADLLI
jgi:Ca2+-binding RTX toxin-like protein